MPYLTCPTCRAAVHVSATATEPCSSCGASLPAPPRGVRRAIPLARVIAAQRSQHGQAFPPRRAASG